MNNLLTGTNCDHQLATPILNGEWKSIWGSITRFFLAFFGLFFAAALQGQGGVCNLAVTIYTGPAQSAPDVTNGSFFYQVMP